MLWLWLVFNDAEALEAHEVLVPMSFVWCDIEYEEIEHCDEGEAFVEFRERDKDPCDVVEPD